MPLKVTIELVGYYGVDRKINELYIGRDEDLKDRNGGEHKYTVSPTFHPWETLTEFHHEYSDGAEVCVRKALEALESEGYVKDPRKSH
jgi:hypothetical protein